jgi:hypothetical protein
MSNFEILVTRAMFDPEFARLLKADPAAALKEIGIEPTKERLAAIAKVDLNAVEKAAEAVGYERVKPMN